MKIEIIHTDWKDVIYLKKNRLYRIQHPEEAGNYVEHNSILEIHWDKWGTEYFHNNHNQSYSLCNKIKLGKSECFMDLIHQYIYNPQAMKYGTYKICENEKLYIEWINNDNQFNISHPPVSLETSNKIPNIIHFIYGLKEQDEEFPYYKYIAIRSAYEINRPDHIYFYYHYEPYGHWWEKSKEYMTLEKVELITQIYGNPVNHYAHQTDIIRLQKLIERGGVYLDMDTICIHSFHSLYRHSFVIGEQLNDTMTDVYGLCNAVILSEPQSPFAIQWLESYKTFRSTGRDIYWDEHSVLKPYQMYKEKLWDIHVLDGTSFFYPLWYDIQHIMFQEMNSENALIYQKYYSQLIQNSYCIHLWDTYSSSYLKTLTSENTMTQNTLYNILCRKYIKNNISLVFLTYNRLEKTRTCLESYLVLLDREDIQEILLFDNGSQEDMKEYLIILQSFHPKIRVIFNPDNIGVCLGRIELFKEAIGDIIISLDSDAELLHDSFIDKVKTLLYDEKHGLVGVSGAFIPSWEFGTQKDIPDEDVGEYEVQHISGCCQCFRRDMFLFSIALDPLYGKFWVEDTDFSMQFLYLGKISGYD